MLNRKAFIFTLDTTFALYITMILLTATIIYFSNIDQINYSYLYLYSFSQDVANFVYYFNITDISYFLDKYGLAVGNECKTHRLYISYNFGTYDYGTFDNGDPNIWFQSKLNGAYVYINQNYNVVCFKNI